MRDAPKGRKSWLERLTSPPEADADEPYPQDTPYPQDSMAGQMPPGPPGPGPRIGPGQQGPPGPGQPGPNQGPNQGAALR